ncbi:hypothetical protein HCN52_07245 [Streptomyces bohaiensis]|uniref:Uncharacterized protein n=1 Tax=Streptomyces bohaiensis TaxID=1431344 RepID=A0ABX1CA05_9ACTN|nr:hypothetical protein [Streptomyces bohaiensis]
MRDTAGGTRDDRWDALVSASARLRTALDDYRAPLIDRGVAEQELAALHRMAAGGAADPSALSGRLLLVASAVGSVRVLSPALAELRAAVGRLGPGVTSVTVIPPPHR